MQYGATYIGRSFALLRTHHLSDKESLPLGNLGVAKAVDLKSTSMLLEFTLGDRTIKAWINENNLKLIDSAPLPMTEAPKAEQKFKNLREYQPQMMAVKSTNVKAIGHFDEGMVVEFTNGTAYIYPGVNFDAYNDVLMADSVGKAYNAKIKMAKNEKDELLYKSTKLEA